MASVPAAATIGKLLRDARRRLAAAPFTPARREAALLLARVLERGEASVLAHAEEAVPAAAAARFRSLLERRLAGEPVAYLFGEREFYGRPFAVDLRVLIPRPETEHLIEAVLALDLPPRPHVADAGTGSGAIAVTLALEIPEVRLVATDVSLDALAVAHANVRRHGAGQRVTLVGADLLRAIDLARIDVVAANPPYVDPADASGLSPEVTAFEPHLALFAPDRGRALILRLLDETAALRPGAHLVMEIGHDQGEWLAAAVDERPEWELVEIVQDYGGVHRTAVLRRVHRAPGSMPCAGDPGPVEDPL